MRVLIIGGTGFIGPHVVRALDALGHDITVYHRGTTEAELPPRVRHVRDAGAAMPVMHFPSALVREEPDVVVHMTPMGERDARAALNAFAGIAGRMVALSSGDVYRAYGILQRSEAAPHEASPLREESPLRSGLYPYRAHAQSEEELAFHYEKILAERVLVSDPRLSTTILRLPAVYGPGDPQRRLRRWIVRMVDGRPAIALDAREASWRWTHGYVGNVAAAIALAVTNARAAGRVYNVGEALTPSFAERVRQLADALGWTGDIVAVPPDRWTRTPPLPPLDFRQDLAYDTSRIREELGYREPVSLDEGLRRSAEWERTHPPEGEASRAAEYVEEDAAVALAAHLLTRHGETR
jgi:nucleoside-diphosphate-sugar epimerase